MDQEAIKHVLFRTVNRKNTKHWNLQLYVLV